MNKKLVLIHLLIIPTVIMLSLTAGLLISPNFPSEYEDFSNIDISTSTDSEIVTSEVSEEVVVIDDTDQDNIVTPEPTYKTFHSERYDLSFDYPVEWGDTIVEFNDDYFNDEIVTFTNASWTMIYPRFEGGWAEVQDCGDVTTKDGRTGDIQCFSNDDGQNWEVTVLLPVSSNGTNYYFGYRGTFPASELETKKNEVTTLFSTLSYNLNIK